MVRRLRAMSLVCGLVASAPGCGRLFFDSMDSAAEDAGSDSSDAPSNYCGGPPRSCDSTLYCEGFDDSAVIYVECDGDNFQCGPAIPEADFELVTTPVCAGNSSLEVSTMGGPGTKQNAYGYFGPGLALPDDYFTRFFLRVPSGTNALGSGNLGGTEFFVAFATNGVWPRVDLGRSDGELRMLIDQSSEFVEAGWQRDTWHCVEVHLTPTLLEVWLDEKRVGAMAYGQPPEFVNWNAIGVGIVGSHPEGETHLQIDEFAIAGSKLGCL